MPDYQQSRFAPLKGLSGAWVSPPQYASVAQDLEWDPRGGWREAAGYEHIMPDVQGVSPFAGQGKVKSLFWFSQHNGGPQWLLWDMGGTLVYFYGGTTNAAKWSSIATGRFQTSMPWAGTQYAAVGNSVWIVNGEDAPLRFDGWTTYRAGFQGPAPILTVEGYNEGFVWGTSYANLGLGVEADNGVMGGGEYAYLMTEVNEFGTESPPSPVYANVKWDVAALGGAKSIPQTKYFTRVRIPPRSRTDIVARRLYRTMNAKGLGLQDGSTFYLVAEFRGSKAFTYVDDLPDSYLGPALDPTLFGPWPQGAKYIAYFKGCFVLAGMPSAPDTVAYSTPGQIENFPSANYFRIGDPDSGEVTGLYPTRDALVILKRRGVYLLVADAGTGRFSVRTLTKDVGCSGVNTVKELPGVGLVFVSDAGVYVLTGISQAGDAPVAYTHISQEIQDYWQNHVNHGALANAAGCVWHQKKQYRLCVPVDGAPDNAVTLVYHYEQQTWTLDPSTPFACMVETRDHRNYLYAGSSDDTSHPGVYVFTHWAQDKDGTAIAPTYRSATLDLGSVYDHAHVKDVEVRAITYGSHNLQLKYYVDEVSTAVNATGQLRAAQDPENALPVWDTAIWSTSANWQRVHPTVLRFSVAGTGKVFQWEASLGSGAARLQLLEAVIGYSFARARTIRPLDTAITTGTGS